MNSTLGFTKSKQKETGGSIEIGRGQCASRTLLYCYQQNGAVSNLLTRTSTKIQLMYSFLGIASLCHNFHIHVYVSNSYIPRISPHISCSRIGRSIVGIYKSLTDTECGNWDCGRAIPFLSIFVFEFSVLFLCIVRWHLRGDITDRWLKTGFCQRDFSQINKQRRHFCD